jgi:hypothetical protein
MVFVAESFDLDMARKLTALLLDAQGTGEIHTARAIDPESMTQPQARSVHTETGESLTANFIRFFSNCGLIKAAVDAAVMEATPAK